MTRWQWAVVRASHALRGSAKLLIEVLWELDGQAIRGSFQGLSRVAQQIGVSTGQAGDLRRHLIAVGLIYDCLDGRFIPQVPSHFPECPPTGATTESRRKWVAGYSRELDKYIREEEEAALPGVSPILDARRRAKSSRERRKHVPAA